MSDAENSATAPQDDEKVVSRPRDSQFSAISPNAAGWFGAGLVGLALVCFVLVNWSTPTSSLGSAALAGTAILAIGLVALIVLSRAVGIVEPSAALGLPPGSIRALLALGLAIVFVSVASWVLGGLFDPTGRAISTVQMARGDVDAYRKNYPDRDYIIGETSVPVKSGTPTDVIVKVYLKQDQGMLDMAKQILTISATVLVTVVGFYFGSNSSSEALKSALAGLQGGAAGPATPDAVLGVGREIAGVATDVGKKMTALGSDPMAPLAAALRAASPDVQAKLAGTLVDAQQSFDSLKAAQTDLIAKADRAKELSATVKPDSSAADLMQTRDQLVALRTGVTEASRKFDQSLAAFTAAKDAILQGTAK
ncbi:hypothetical protein PMI42_03706 [Bradyrhizobium sp. YR681]|uniref:hypothetical protein n=1 Tax=Bradyrhizobium sp. YR681 TaxID=1144344 RepID=UPI0002711BD9|nr:hypothetical protein [Bradyrhizobium sp. YR681]EJN13089.1 hypothetical protein PMI42_03706 [Bradyrhizobium sp. YR681]